MAKRAGLSDHLNYNASARPKTSGSLLRQDARISKIQSAFQEVSALATHSLSLADPLGILQSDIAKVARWRGNACVFQRCCFLEGIYAR